MTRCALLVVLLALALCSSLVACQPVVDASSAASAAAPANGATATNPWLAAARAQAAAQEQMMQMAMMRAREREMTTFARTPQPSSLSSSSPSPSSTNEASSFSSPSSSSLRDESGAAATAAALLFDAQPPFTVDPYASYDNPYSSLNMEPTPSSSSPVDSSFDSTPLDMFAPPYASPYDMLVDEDEQVEADADPVVGEREGRDAMPTTAEEQSMDGDSASSAYADDDFSTVRGMPLSWRRSRMPRNTWRRISRIPRIPRISRMPRISRFVARCVDTELEATGVAVQLVSSDRAEVHATIEVREEPAVLDPTLPHPANATSWASNSTFLTELATTVQQRLADLAVLVFAELNVTASALAAHAHVHQLRTLSVLLEPIYEYRDSRQYLRGYRASTAFAFRVDASRAGEVIALITSAGVTRIDSVLFKASARSVQRGRESVLRAATADALGQHEQMVQAMALVKAKAKVKKGSVKEEKVSSSSPTFTSRVMSARVQSLSPPVADTTADDEIGGGGANAGYDYAQPLARLSAFASAASSAFPSSSSSSSSLLYSTLPIFPSDALLRAHVVVRACVRFQ